MDIQTIINKLKNDYENLTSEYEKYLFNLELEKLITMIDCSIYNIKYRTQDNLHKRKGIKMIDI